MGNAIERWRQVRADRRDEAGRPFWNGDGWSVAERRGLCTWHYRAATAAEVVAYGIAMPAPCPAPAAVVAGPAPARLALVAGDAA